MEFLKNKSNDFELLGGNLPNFKKLKITVRNKTYHKPLEVLKKIYKPINLTNHSINYKKPYENHEKIKTLNNIDKITQTTKNSTPVISTIPPINSSLAYYKEGTFDRKNFCNYKTRWVTEDHGGGNNKKI
jgi:hypothetical protein